MQTTDVLIDPKMEKEWIRQREQARKQVEKQSQETEKAQKKLQKKAEKLQKKAEKEARKLQKKAEKQQKQAEKAAKKSLGINVLNGKQQEAGASQTYTEVPAAPVNQEAETSQAVSVLPILAILGVCLYFVLKQRKTSKP